MQILNALTILALLACLSSPALASDFVTVDAPTSFRGLKWGAERADIKDLLPINGAGYKNTFYRKNERLTFGDASIVSVAYYFRKDKLYRVGVAFSGRANHFLIKERLLSMYGRGRGVGQRYGWMWPDFSVEITYDEDAKGGALYYTYEGTLE